MSDQTSLSTLIREVIRGILRNNDSLEEKETLLLELVQHPPTSLDLECPCLESVASTPSGSTNTNKVGTSEESGNKRCNRRKKTRQNRNKWRQDQQFSSYNHHHADRRARGNMLRRGRGSCDRFWYNSFNSNNYYSFSFYSNYF